VRFPIIRMNVCLEAVVALVSLSTPNRAEHKAPDPPQAIARAPGIGEERIFTELVDHNQAGPMPSLNTPQAEHTR
jgi:hypothetical protein